MCSMVDAGKRIPSEAVIPAHVSPCFAQPIKVPVPCREASYRIQDEVDFDSRSRSLGQRCDERVSHFTFLEDVRFERNTLLCRTDRIQLGFVEDVTVR